MRGGGGGGGEGIENKAVGGSRHTLTAQQQDYDSEAVRQ